MSGPGSLATGGFEGEKDEPMDSPLVPQEHHFLALCLCTESNRRSEWPLIAQVIYNRVKSPRYPDTAIEVILQRSQFSAFNAYTSLGMPPRDIFQAVAAKVTKQLGGAVLFAYAVDHAAKMVEADVDGHRISDLITPQTLHYWSPVSMPKGKRPAWAPSASRLYTPPGFDPQRFVFAENVP